MSRAVILLMFVMALSLSACNLLNRSVSEDDAPIIHYPEPDPVIAAMIESHRDTLEAIMGMKVATVEDTIRFDRPEGALGNMVSDALRFRAAKELRQFVHIGVVDEGSFKLYLVPGDLTLMDVYEFMPYQNHLVILEVKGEKVENLVSEVAAAGGAPISGVRFSIGPEGKPRGILVDAEVLDKSKSYLIATTSYVADMRSPLKSLQNAESRIDIHDVTIRQLYIDYFRNRYQLRAETDGRIRQ